MTPASTKISPALWSRVREIVPERMWTVPVLTPPCGAGGDWVSGGERGGGDEGGREGGREAGRQAGQKGQGGQGKEKYPGRGCYQSVLNAVSGSVLAPPGKEDHPLHSPCPVPPAALLLIARNPFLLTDKSTFSPHR